MMTKITAIKYKMFPITFKIKSIKNIQLVNIEQLTSIIVFDSQKNNGKFMLYNSNDGLYPLRKVSL